jgi:hypothetical protein
VIQRRDVSAVTIGARRFTASTLIWASLGCAVLWHIGLNVDAWYHLHYGFEIETFFTPAHGLIYGGWIAFGTATMLYLAESIVRGEEREAWLPPGFRLVLFGLALFGVGGTLDLIWHSFAGFEVSFEALVTPPHLILFTTFVLSVLGLLVAAVAYRGSPDHSSWRIGRRDVPTVWALAILFGVSLYALGWVDPLAVDYASGGIHASSLFGYARLTFRGETAQVAGVTGIVIHCVIQTVFVLCPLRLLRLPTGYIATLMLWVGLILAFDQGQWTFLPAIVTGALVGEAIWWWIRDGGLGGPSNPRGYWLLAFFVPVAEFLVYDAMVAFAVGGLAWPVHLWAGAPIMAGLYSTLIAVLIVPPRYLASISKLSWPDT